MLDIIGDDLALVPGLSIVLPGGLHKRAVTRGGTNETPAAFQAPGEPILTHAILIADGEGADPRGLKASADFRGAKQGALSIRIRGMRSEEGEDQIRIAAAVLSAYLNGRVIGDARGVLDLRLVPGVGLRSDPAEPGVSVEIQRYQVTGSWE